MIIKKLDLLSFGKFKDYTLELKPGVNLIYGENESGKSTLHSFIEGMFYGFLKPFVKKTIYSEKHENYHPINSNLYRGNIEFKIDDLAYIIERDFKKGYESTRVYEKTTGQDITYRASELSSGKVVQPGIYFFGLSDLVFKNTVFIGQQGVYTDEKLADEVRDKLVNVVTTKDENISVNKAMDILDLELKEIGTERAYTSKYGILTKRLGDKKADLKEIQEKRSSYNEWVEKSIEIDIQRESLRIKIIKAEELLNQINLVKRLKKYNEALELERDIKLLNKELDALKEFRSINIDDYSKAEFLDHDMKNLKVQIENIKLEMENIEFEKNRINIWKDSEIKELDAIIEDGSRVKQIKENMLNKSISELEGEVKKNKKDIRNLKIGAGLLLALYIFLAFYFLWIKNYLFLAASQIIILLVVLLLFKSKLIKNNLILLDKNEELNKNILDIISKYKLASIEEFFIELEYAQNKKDEVDNFNTELIKLNDRMEISKNKLSNLQKVLLENKTELEKILDINIQKNLEDFKKSKSQKQLFDELQKELEITSINLKKLLDGEAIEDLRINKELIKDFEMDLKSLDQERILDDLNSLKINLEKLNLNHREYKVQIENLEVEISKEASLKEDVLSLESKIDSLDKKRKSIQYALKRIKELSSDIHRDYAPIINKRVGKMVNNITDGKYKAVKIDKNLNVSLQTKRGDQLIDFDKLSQGTMDQIYFSLRMGLTEEIIDKNLPLVLDECFAQYDDKRLQSILKFIMGKEATRQIILFTCHKREKKILDNLGIAYNYISL